MFDNTPSDKIQFRALGEAPAPGTCFVCGAANREDGYVDLGVWLEYIGQALLCSFCLTQAAELIGMLTLEEAQHIRGVAENTANDLASLRTELEASNEQLGAYRLLLSSNHSAYLDLLGAGDSASPTLFDEAVESSGVGEREITESSVSERGSELSDGVGEIDGTSSTESTGLLSL